jgi:hypothetical protein
VIDQNDQAIRPKQNKPLYYLFAREQDATHIYKHVSHLSEYRGASESAVMAGMEEAAGVEFMSLSE